MIAASRMKIMLAITIILVMILPGCAPETDRQNIVLVVLDTMRRDASSLSDGGGRWTGLTPNLKQLASEGTAFPNAWSVAPWTVPSHASIFTGLLPSSHGCTMSHLRLDPNLPTIAGLLSKAGYETGAFYSIPWLSDRVTGLLNGFKRKEESPIGDLNNLISPMGDQGGLQTLSNVSEWLNKHSRKKPFFLFVNLLEAHLPYNPPADYRKAHLSDLAPDDQVTIAWGHEYNAGLHPDNSVDWDRVDRLYGGDVNTADRLLGNLISLLKEHELYDETILIVTSDHGENIGDHGLMEHQYSVHETLLAVPLVIRAPEMAIAQGERSDPVLTTDLFATILDAAGISMQNMPLHSRSLLKAPAKGMENRLLIAEYDRPHNVLIDNLSKINPELDVKKLTPAWKTVRVGSMRLTSGSDGTVMLHDMSTDPVQETNLAKDNAEEVIRLLSILTHSRTVKGVYSDDTMEVDETTRRQLKSLGYF